MLRLVLFSGLVVAVYTAPISPHNKLFGHAIKNGPLPAAKEVTTFEHLCGEPPCTITHMHIPSIYPGTGCPWDWENGRLRVYVDGEKVPTLDLSILEVASVGALAARGDLAPSDGSPFGHALFGKTAKTGGVYSTVRIPFGVQVRTTIQAPSTCNTTSVYWFIVRGLERMPVTLGDDFVLPDQARLVIWRLNNHSMAPYEYVQFAQSDTAMAGALLNVMLDAQSADLNYLEGCLRFYANGSEEPIYLSSGTEDYFNGASYWDLGMYTTSESGVTFKQNGNTAAYKLHTRDYVVWQKGFNLTWRNNENSCPNSWPPMSDPHVPSDIPSLKSNNARATVSALVWGYVWSSDPSTLTFASSCQSDGAAASTISTKAADSTSWKVEEAKGLARLDSLLALDLLDSQAWLAARRWLEQGRPEILSLLLIFKTGQEERLATKIREVLSGLVNYL